MTQILTKDGKVSIPSIIDPMLLKGGFTRADIIAAVRAARPDYKDPAAPISDRMKALLKEGKAPSLVWGERKAPRAKGVKVGPTRRTIDEGMARIDAWAARMDAEISAGFKRLAEMQAAEAARPRLKRIWA